MGLLACATWAATAALFRISSLSALVCAAAAPVWALVAGYPEGGVLILGLTVLVFMRHADNIRRLREGTEPKIGAGK